MGAKILIKLVLEASFSALGAILAPRADKTSKRWVRPPFVPTSGVMMMLIMMAMTMDDDYNDGNDDPYRLFRPSQWA